MYLSSELWTNYPFDTVFWYILPESEKWETLQILKSPYGIREPKL